MCGSAWPRRKRPPHTRRPRNPTGVSAVRLRGWHWPRARSDRFRPEIRHHIEHAAHVERQRLGVEAHEIRLGALRQRWFIGRSTPATTTAVWPAESSQRTISTKYTPLPVESGFCAEIFRMRIRATFPSNSNHHTVTQRKAAQADRESRRQAREKPKAQRFTKICPHASAMQGMIGP